MAIQFARARYVSRRDGGNAVRSAAYNAREAIAAERTGEVFYFRHRAAPEHHEVLLPEGAAARFAEAAVFWNAAEQAEKRKDAQVARELVVALPANARVSAEDRLALVRSFAEEHFVAKGLAVQLDIHAPHQGEAESERANWHAHLLVTTRRLEGEAFAARKARDLDPEVRHAGGRAVVADGEAWGELWRDHQNRYFREHGLEIAVDPVALHPGPHIGPVRMRVAGSEIVARAERIRHANEAAARDPAQVLDALTRHNATFTARDVERYLAKHLEDPEERRAVKLRMLLSEEVVRLYDSDSGASVHRYTTRAVREEEKAVLAAAAALAERYREAVPSEVLRRVNHERGLRYEQQRAFVHTTGGGELSLIEGRAGTGKSRTLAAIHDAYRRSGSRVVGLAPTNTVAQDLKAAGFAETSTVHAALFRLNNGRDQWGPKTVVIVDEAAMLGTRITGELLSAARQAEAKVILAGDDRQLASIERGGLFRELAARHGAAEITEVTRQQVPWQRQAAHDLAEGRFAAAVTAFDRAGAIAWTETREDARAALVAAWSRDTAHDPEATRFVFAYTNRDVDRLNAELRAVRRDRGELGGAETEFETKHGRALFAAGDRVQLTATDKKAGLYNGTVGTVTELDPAAGTLRARLDDGRDVTWRASEFDGFRHGYAGTIYKGQGKTLDHTYLYHTEHWRAAASYVALTRQRESAQVFVARDTAPDAHVLARQMARGEVKSSSLAWATREELSEARAAAQSLPRTRSGGRGTAGERETRGAGQSVSDNADDRRARLLAAFQPPDHQAAPPDRDRQAQDYWRTLAPHVSSATDDARLAEFRAMDPAALRTAAAVDQVGSIWSGRAMTVEDAARLMSPAYAAAADHAAQLKQQAEEVKAAIERGERAWRFHGEEGERRRHDIGLVRQALHRSGVHADPWMQQHEDGQHRAAAELAQLRPHRAALARLLPDAEKQAAATLDRVQPQAAAELARRQERAGLARAVLEERQEQQRAQHREQQHERRQGRDLGLGR